MKRLLGLSVVVFCALCGCARSQWEKEAAKLTTKQRSNLADMTAEVHCEYSTWNPDKLWWQCDFDPNKHGPRAILPYSAAVAAHKKAQDDAWWCDPAHDLGLSDGYTLYKCEPNANGPEGRKGHWTVNTKAMEEEAARERHKDELAAALTTRVLTSAELHEVLQYGAHIYIHNMQSFRQEDIDEEYRTALAIQEQLRRMPGLNKKCKSGAVKQTRQT